MSAIVLQNLTKRYDDHMVVDHLNFSIEEGECLALLGVNGAGKTTVIKILSCLTAPSEGDALLLGHSIRTDALAVKSVIGISPQETAIAPNLSVLENLEFIAGICGKFRTDAKAKADTLMQQFSLTPLQHQKARTLSGGWQRRLSIAMALATSPKILFLDEPTLGLDILARRELWSLLESLRGKLTIILTTHYLEEAEALSDRIAILARGRLCALGTAEELKARTGCSRFEDAFVALASEEEVL